MPLVFENHQVSDVTVVACRGSIVEGAESRALQVLLGELFPTSPYVVTDLSHVDFVDSSGLGMLVRMAAKARAAGGGLKLCGVPTKIADVLRITRLSEILETYDSESAAIAACSGRPGPDASSPTI